MNQFLSGAVFIVILLTSIQFFGFWRRTRDRFFVFFSVAFVLMALERFLIAFKTFPAESSGNVYLVRLAAFLLLLFAIVEKNLEKRGTLHNGGTDNDVREKTSAKG